jgi:hypothetical protein
MRRIGIGFFIGFVLIVQTNVALAGPFSRSLEQYKEETRTALGAEANEEVKKYLLFLLEAADRLNGLEAGDSSLPAALDALAKKHLEADDLLTGRTSGSPAVRAEKVAYDKYLQPYEKRQYIWRIALQQELLERKYFQTETAKNANYFEGLVNSRWALTRADLSALNKTPVDPHLGVSPWEAIFRLEPALAFHDGTQVALLGTAGLSYTFFPDIDLDKTPPSLEETFWSDWIKKSGGRVGIGIGRKDNKSYLLTGLGVQVNAVGIWGIYQPDDKIFMLGLSTSDLSGLKKVLPWFE